MQIKVEGGEAVAPGKYEELGKEITEVIKKGLYFSPEVIMVSPGSLPKYKLKAKLIRKVSEEKP